MHSAHDLLTRWPALDVAAKRARLQDTFQLSPGPLRDVGAASAEAAERAAAGLWRRDPAVWSGDPAVQRTIANRLGLAQLPGVDGGFAPQAGGVRVDRSAGTDLPTSCCSAWAARASPRRCCARCSASRLAGRAFTCSTRPIRPPFARSRPLPARTLYILASKSGTTIEPNSLAAHFRRVLEERVPRWNDHFVAITDEGTALARARAGRAVSRGVHQSLRHRRPLLRAVVLRPRPGGADGPGRRRASSAGAWRCCRRASRDSAT